MYPYLRYIPRDWIQYLTLAPDGIEVSESLILARKPSWIHPRTVKRAIAAVLRGMNPLQITMVSSTGRCGIAEYTKSLVATLPAWCQVQVVEPGPGPWTGDVLHIQYEPGLFPDGNELLAQVTQFPGVKVLTAHFYDAWLKQNHRRFHRVIVHHPDLVRDTRHIYLVQGCPIFPEKEKQRLRQRRGIPERSHVIASFGFYMAWKRLAEFFENLCPHLSMNPELYLLWLHSIHPGAVDYGTRALARIERLVTMYKLTNIQIHTKYLDKGTINDYLQASDIGCLYSPLAVSTGSSAVSKEYVAGRCPLVVSDISHYADLPRGVIRVPTETSVQGFIYRVLSTLYDTHTRFLLQQQQRQNYDEINYTRVAKKHAGWYWELCYPS